MTKREKIIVGVMCLTIAYGAYELIGARAPQKSSVRQLQVRSKDEVGQFVKDLTQRMLKERMTKEFQYVISQAGKQWMRDPFIPTTAPLKTGQDKKYTANQSKPKNRQFTGYRYTGFMQMGSTKYAVINDIEYAIGESIGMQGYYLKNITLEGAVLGRVNSKETIRLPLIESY